MKAKEYMEKYFHKPEEGMAIVEPSDIIDHRALFEEMFQEVLEITKKRRAISPESRAAVIAEVNQKWNAVNTLCFKRCGIRPLAENAIVDAFSDVNPGLKEAMKLRGPARIHVFSIDGVKAYMPGTVLAE